jgi:hypothetical protein
MRDTIIIFLFLTSINCFAQDNSIEICQRSAGNELLEAIFLPDSTINIRMTGSDNADDSGTRTITIYSGTPKEYYTFICELEEFTTENDPDPHTKIIDKIYGISVSLEKSLGAVILVIYDQSGRGFHRLPLAWIPKFKDKFTEWANSKNVPFQ